MIFAVVFLISAAGLLGVIAGYPLRGIGGAFRWLAERTGKGRRQGRSLPPIEISREQHTEPRPAKSQEAAQ
jgi:hypothetical protein